MAITSEDVYINGNLSGSTPELTFTQWIGVYRYTDRMIKRTNCDFHTAFSFAIAISTGKLGYGRI